MRRKNMWEQILSTVEKVNSFLNGIVWGWPVVILILGTGILLTVRTKFLHNRYLGHCRHRQHSRRCFGDSHGRSRRGFLDVDLGVFRNGN